MGAIPPQLPGYAGGEITTGIKIFVGVLCVFMGVLCVIGLHGLHMESQTISIEATIVTTYTTSGGLSGGAYGESQAM